jgi:hypothetical protein
MVTLDLWTSRAASPSVNDDGNQIAVHDPGSLILEQSGIVRFTGYAPPEVDIAISMEFAEHRGQPEMVHATFDRPAPGAQSFEEIGRRMLHKQIYWDFKQ